MPAKKKTAKKAARKKARPRTGPRKLTARQERFCELVASGLSHTEAWIQAGYKVTREVAKVNACESLTKPHIASRVAELRKPQTEAALMTRDFKRQLMREIAIDPKASRNDRIRACAEDAKLAGHYEPDRHEIDLGDKTLLSIKERAMRMESVLVARYESREGDAEP